MKKKIIQLIPLLLLVSISYSQNLLTNQNSLVVINPGVPFMVEGSATNTGLIQNEGALRLTGDWSNGGDYRSVSGTFTLAGQNQVFDPGNSTYGHLGINSSGVVITGDLNISTSLELTNGIVSIASGSKILLEQTALLTGGDEGSYIDGALFTATTGDFTFPVGTEFEYLPVTLTNIQSNDSIGIQAFSTQLNASISTQLDDYSPNRYWEVLGNDESVAEGITLPMINENFIEEIEEAVIAFANTNEGMLNPSGIPSYEGTLTSGSISTAGDILAGYYLIADQSVVGPPIKVINVVTSLQDGKHDFLRIENIEFYEGNLVEIFDRQGVKVFEMDGYNNTDRVFRGTANVGSRGMLETGSYYYTVQLTSSKREAGFIYIKN